MLQAEHRGGGDIDVGWRLIVERDAENLADVLREHVEFLGRREQASVPDIARPAHVDDARRRAVRIDEGEIDRGRSRGALLRRIGRQCSGEAGDDRVTQIQVWRTIGLLRTGAAGMKKAEQQ